MNNALSKSTYFRISTQFVDLLVLNIWCVAFYFLLGTERRIEAFDSYVFQYWLICNISYIMSLFIAGAILQKRIVRPEVIVSHVSRIIIIAFFLFLSGLSIAMLPAIHLKYVVPFYLVAFAFIVLAQLSLRLWILNVRSYGRNSRSAVVVGDGGNMLQIIQTLKQSEMGYNLLGVFSFNEELEGFPEGVSWLGYPEDVVGWLSSNKVDDVFCGLPSKHRDEILPIINYCENNLLRFYSVPNLRNYLKRKMTVDKCGDVLILAIRREPLGRITNRVIKRFVDFSVSTIFLCTVYPFLYLIIGSIIKISSPGPIYFRQQRTGLNGKSFGCYKFRSMKVNNDSDKVQATLNDPRKTKIGNFLRKTNLDELPQLINVWRGEMSLVGPRPHMLKHTEDYSKIINKYMVRHLVKPGITGWAQVNGYRGETKTLPEMEGRVIYDIWYLENWSFWLDIRIMVYTITNMLQGEKNAY